VPQVRVLPGADFFLGEIIMAFGTDKKPGSSDWGSGGSDSSSSSFFGKTMRIEGEITSDEDLTIEGKVTGQLEISKTLTIGKEGYVNGEISAAVVLISGEAEGRLMASDKLDISSEGKFSGNILADTIRVAEGAQIKGTINLDDETTPANLTDKKAESSTPPSPPPKKTVPGETSLQTEQPGEKKEPGESSGFTQQEPEKKESRGIEGKPPGLKKR
jgi:cytoskeletal protein CcmA (bactofilin family)